MKYFQRRNPPEMLSLEEFASRLASLMPALMRQMAAENRNYFARGLITLPQLRILAFLEERSPCPMRELARGLALRCPTITSMMDRLCAMGLARRERSEADRRVVLAALTAKGRRVMGRVNLDRKRMAMRAFAGLSAEDRAVYLDILQRIVAGLSGRQKQAED